MSEDVICRALPLPVVEEQSLAHSRRARSDAKPVGLSPYPDNCLDSLRKTEIDVRLKTANDVTGINDDGRSFLHQGLNIRKTVRQKIALFEYAAELVVSGQTNGHCGRPERAEPTQVDEVPSYSGTGVAASSGGDPGNTVADLQRAPNFGSESSTNLETSRSSTEESLTSSTIFSETLSGDKLSSFWESGAESGRSPLDVLIDRLERICDEFDLPLDELWSEDGSTFCWPDAEDSRELAAADVCLLPQDVAACQRVGESLKDGRPQERCDTSHVSSLEEATMDRRLTGNKYRTYNQASRDKAFRVVPTLCVKSSFSAPSFSYTPRALSGPPSPLNSPQSLRSQVRAKPDLPAYLTLGRRNDRPKPNARSSFGSCEAVYYGDDFSNDEESEDRELQKIRSILAGLDFSKFRRVKSQVEERKPKEPENNYGFRRCLSSSYPLSGSMDRSSLVPKTSFSKSANSKLKELTEKLKPCSFTAPPSPNMSKNSSPVSKTFPTVNRSSSFTNVDSPSDAYGESRLPHHGAELAKYVKGNVTLPRRKNNSAPLTSPFATLSRVTKTNLGSEPLTLDQRPKYSQQRSMNQSDLSLDSTIDDGYEQSHCFVPQRPDRRRDIFSPAEVNPNNPPVPEKRKRRKGFGIAPSVTFHSPKEITKSSNGRSLTYPLERKSSLPGEELDYTSVDSNRLKSFNRPSSRHPYLQSSDISITDSQYSPSDSPGDDPYQDPMEGVHFKTRTHQVTSYENQYKNTKKKHHSDPGTDKVVVQPGKFSQVIISSRSEPELGDSTDSGKEESKRLVLRVSSSQTETTVTHHRRTGSGSLTPSALVYPQLFSEDNSSKSPQQHRRYSKKRLRGPYGEMLEEEMRKSGEKSKPSADDLSFLQEVPEPSPEDVLICETAGDTARTRHTFLSTSQSLDDSELKKSSGVSDGCVPKRKVSANIPLIGEESASFTLSPPVVSNTTSEPNLNRRGYLSSATALERWAGESEKLAERSLESSLFRNVSPLLADTRTHVVGELYDTERSYVESLQIIVNKYMKPLKSPDYSGVVESCVVDEIFFQIPEILSHHETFLDLLRQRLSSWDNKQKIGDVFIEAFTKQPITDTYTAFINNWKSAKEAIKVASHAKPAFAKFLEHMSREHKGKLTLDALLIMPVQRIPRYELLIKELIKHTHIDHPDHQLLILAQKEVHDLAVKINRVEREAYQQEQMQQKVREIEHLIDGVMELVQPDRIFIRYDMVTIPGGLGAKKDRCLFLFSDLLLITSIKRKSGTMRKSSSASGSPSPFGTMELNKYKLLMRFSLDNLDIAKCTDSTMKKIISEIENLEEDLTVMNQIGDLSNHLHCPHQNLDDAVRDLLGAINKQLNDKQSTDAQLLSLELTVTTQEGVDSLNIIFTSAEKRTSWEEAFNEAKQKLALSTDRRPPPEFMYPLPIRKTRAGLQFTCSASTLGLNQYGLKDVWVCNSDGYVGQVCVLSLQPEPNILSCNGVCNARILCATSIPAATPFYLCARRKSVLPDNCASVNVGVEDTEDEDQMTNNGKFQLDSDSSEEEEESVEYPDDENQQQEGSESSKEEKEETDNMQPTMWLGTEDGCIHVYNCGDNIRIKKNKIKIQHTAAIHCIIYLDNRVFASLANGEIVIYRREPEGGWCTANPPRVQVGSTSAPVIKMLAVAGKLWCGCQNTIKVLNTANLEIEHSFQVSSDSSRSVLCLVTSGLGVWVALQHSAVLRLFHATSYECLLDANITPAVTKMLSGCDDIIRQHKAACLRVTSLLACKDLLWVGTSAGVLLTLPLPHLTSSTTRLDNVPNVAGVPHGHTGHVRFLTSVEMSPTSLLSCSKFLHRSVRTKEGLSARRASLAASTVTTSCRILVISGGDGYEDFRNTGLTESAGRDDSTNHLLLWQV